MNNFVYVHEATWVQVITFLFCELEDIFPSKSISSSSLSLHVFFSSESHLFLWEPTLTAWTLLKFAFLATFSEARGKMSTLNLKWRFVQFCII